jgi:uncharacterized membrane protein
MRFGVGASARLFGPVRVFAGWANRSGSSTRRRHGLLAGFLVWSIVVPLAACLIVGSVIVAAAVGLVTSGYRRVRIRSAS